MSHKVGVLGLGVLLLCAAPGRAQVSPYAGEAPRELTSLSNDEVRSLLEGAGMGFARPAELNGVPGPRHSLDMADQLNLDEAQRARLQEVFTRMNATARELGAEVVARERGLDALFATGTASAEEVERQTAAIAMLYGWLRAVHLLAHVETAQILNEQQIARYAQLRGYAQAGQDGEEHGAHH
jgi:Spy/CpxP family protein refolding chaperone